MMYGTIQRVNGWLVLRVEDNPSIRYLWYSKRECIRLYRIANGLQGKHITWAEEGD